MDEKKFRTRAGETKKQMYHYIVCEYMDQGNLHDIMSISRLNEESCVRVATYVSLYRESIKKSYLYVWQ